jgi:hypothetical protein
VILDPADHDLFGQISKRDQAVGALKPHAAIGATGIRAIVGIDGVVSGKNKTVVGFALKVGDRPK